MLISLHVLSGALVGRAVRRPPVALAAGVASHLALDRLPHWGAGRGWPPVAMDEETFRVAVVDGLVGLGLIALVARVTSRPLRPQVLAAVVGACLPDLDKPGRRYLGRSPWPQWFDRFHACLQVDVEAPHRLPHELALGAVLGVVSVGVLSRR